MPFGTLQIPSWLIPRPFQPGYGNTQQPMPGESQFDYDVRRMLVNGVRAFGKLDNDFSRNGPGGWGAQMDQYITAAKAPTTGPALPAKAPLAARPTAKPAVQQSSSGPRPFSRDSVADMVSWARNRGATITSWDRNAAHNKDVGGVGNSYHLTGQAFDSTPPKGFSMADWQAEVKKRYPQWDVINEGDHVHVEPPGQTEHSAMGPALGAFSSAMSATGLNAPPPGFDNSGYQRADQLLAGVQQNVMRPFGATYNETPLPELPKPEPFVAPDYSAGDAAFAAAAPKNPFGATPEEQAAGQLRMRRADYFAGMAQALASIDWSHGPGLGELFAKLGAGAVMGAKAGDDEVRARMDKFDEAMQRYQLALANRDDGKAREAADVANRNIDGLNQYKRDQWQIQAKDIQAHNPRVEDGTLITYTRNKDGTVTETHTPLDPAKQTAAAMARANLALGAANAHNEYSWQVYRANREVAAAAMPYAMADANANGNPQGRDGIYAVGLAEAANAVVDSGRWEEVYSSYIGQGRAAQVRAEAERIAGVQPGVAVTESQRQAINDYVSSQMITDFVNSGKGWVLVGGDVMDKNTREKRGYQPPSSAVVSSVAAQRERERKTTRSTNSKGQVTTTERY